MAEYISPQQILKEIEKAVSEITENDFERIYNIINSKKRIFISGQGRSGMAARMFAMRLMHLGLRVYVVGETITPAITSNDLLLVCSGSGETNKVILETRQARTAGAEVLVFTANSNSTLAEASSEVFKVAGTADSGQFGGSLFEQTLIIIFDSIVSYIIAKSEENFSSLEKRHANLE